MVEVPLGYASGKLLEVLWCGLGAGGEVSVARWGPGAGLLGHRGRGLRL
jgi:hypothetical protein